jgi:hypothetical protein
MAIFPFYSCPKNRGYLNPGWTVPEDVVLTKISDTIGPPKPPKDLDPEDGEVL